MLRRPHKNLLALLSILLISMLLAACSSTGSTPTPAPSTPGTSTPEPAKPTTDFPTKPIRLIITHKAGGSTDSIARLVAPYVQKALGGNPVVIENMPGAGGNISRAYVYKEKPDGYTLSTSQFPSMIVGQLVNDGQFKTTEFEPIAQLTGKQAQALVVPADHPSQTFEELVEWSQTNRVTMAGPGVASNGHLGFALFADAGLKAEYVPFGSGPEALTAVAGNQVTTATADTTSIPVLLEEGRVRVLAVAAMERDFRLPDVPTLVDLGHPGMGFEIGIGVLAPPGTPADVVKILRDAFKTALTDPEFLDKAEKADYAVSGLIGDDFGAAIQANFKLVEGFKDLLSVKK